ncbi:MAG: hypothetical protein N2515_00345 [Deltaproteobacteria bacterium]|nr:hypothetical protein [Sandaracinaceae bacterium]MCX7807029.1 hypothetical protein [Deltaproteobacteria bacterium]MDW8245316.1 hypothetical protein [Sandaracinaceae bacterium]
MRISPSSFSIASIAPTSVEEAVAFAAKESAQQSEKASSELRSLSRKARMEAEQAELAKAQSATQSELMAGILQGAGQIAAACATIASSTIQLSSSPPPQGSPAPLQGSHTLKAESTSSAGRLVEGGGNLLRSSMETLSHVFRADSANARMAERETRLNRDAIESIEKQAQEDAQALRGLQERFLEAARTFITERKRAAEAALRA